MHYISFWLSMIYFAAANSILSVYFLCATHTIVYSLLLSDETLNKMSFTQVHNISVKSELLVGTVILANPRSVQACHIYS